MGIPAAGGRLTCWISLDQVWNEQGKENEVSREVREEKGLGMDRLWTKGVQYQTCINDMIQGMYLTYDTIWKSIFILCTANIIWCLNFPTTKNYFDHFSIPCLPIGMAYHTNDISYKQNIETCSLINKASIQEDCCFMTNYWLLWIFNFGMN